MATELREHEERGHSARYLILITLICVATCGVFFSLGFLVGYNERGPQTGPATEVVTAPPVVPPTVNPPPDTGGTMPPGSPASQAAANPAPETEVIPPSGSASPPPAAKSSPGVPPPITQPEPQTKAAAVGEGITLQVAALRTKPDAEALMNTLKSQGYPVFIVSPEYAHAGDSLYRVQVGPFKTRGDADSARAKLLQEGFKPFIKH